MLIKTLEKIKVKTNEYTLDLSKTPNYFNNISTGKSLTNGYKEMVISQNESLNFKKAFSAYGKIFVQLSTGEFCEYNDGEATPLFSIPGDVKIYELNEPSKNRILVYGSTYGTIYDTESKEITSFAFPSVCVGCCVYDGSLFGFSSIKAYFSKRNKYNDYVVKNDDAGYFSIPNRDGKIISVQTLGEYLFVFCQKAIYKVFRNKTTPITIEKLNFKLEIIDKSVFVVGDKVYLINQNKLCEFDGENISFLSTYLDYKTFRKISTCGRLDDKYFVQGYFENEEELSTYLFSPKTLEQTCCTGLNTIYSLDGVCVSKNNKNIVSKIVKGQNQLPFELKTFPVTLDKLDKKSIKSIKINTLSPIKLTVCGDFGQESYNFEGGYSKKNCNLNSTQFAFEIFGQAQDIAIDNFIIEYLVKGD